MAMAPRSFFMIDSSRIAKQVAIEIAERDGRVMVPPYDDYLILAGQATCGLELLEEVPDLDCLLTPCSGGGLFAGVSTAAKAMNPRVRCFPVEPESADDTRQSFVKGERVSIPPPPTIADGLRVQSPGALTFPILQQTAEDVLTVSDEEIIETIKFFLFRMKLLVEPSGAAAAAAVLTGKLPRGTRRVGVIISGGNIDAELLSKFLQPPFRSSLGLSPDPVASTTSSRMPLDMIAPNLHLSPRCALMENYSSLFLRRSEPVDVDRGECSRYILIIVFVLAVSVTGGLVFCLSASTARKRGSSPDD